MKFGIQQFGLREAAKNAKCAKTSLDKIKEWGFDGIELNAFMMGKLSFAVRMLCKMAGMPVGNGDVDWKEEVLSRGLEVISYHKDLNGTLNEPAKTAEDAKALGTKYVNFEVDTYWLSECGVDAKLLLKKLGDRVKLIHVCDRGIRKTDKKGSIKKLRAWSSERAISTLTAY